MQELESKYFENNMNRGTVNKSELLPNGGMLSNQGEDAEQSMKTGIALYAATGKGRVKRALEANKILKAYNMDTDKQ